MPRRDRRRALSEDDDSSDYSQNSGNQEHAIDSCSDNEKNPTEVTDSHRNEVDNPPPEVDRKAFSRKDDKDNSAVDRNEYAGHKPFNSKDAFFYHDDRQADVLTTSPNNGFNEFEKYGRYTC